MGAGLERAEFEHGLYQDRAPQLARLGRMIGDQSAPGKRIHLAGERCLQRAAEGMEGRGHVAQFCVAMGDPLGQARERIHHPPQAGIGGQRAQQGLGLDHLLGVVFDFRRRLEQQTVLRKEWSAIGARYAREERRLPGQALGQRCRGAFGKLRRGCVDDDGDQTVLLGKCRFKDGLDLAPPHIGRE